MLRLAMIMFYTDHVMPVIGEDKGPPVAPVKNSSPQQEQTASIVLVSAPAAFAADLVDIRRKKRLNPDAYPDTSNVTVRGVWAGATSTYGAGHSHQPGGEFVER